MKKIFILFLFFLMVLVHSEIVLDKENNFGFRDLQPMRIASIFAISTASCHILNGFLFKSGFTELEARYYSYFLGIVSGIIFELVTNPKNNGIVRENSLIGVSFYLLTIRF